MQKFTKFRFIPIIYFLSVLSVIVHFPWGVLSALECKLKFAHSLYLCGTPLALASEHGPGP